LERAARSSFLPQVVQAITEVDRAHFVAVTFNNGTSSIEKQIPGGLLLSAAYVGPRALICSSTRSKSTRFSDELLAQAAGVSCGEHLQSLLLQSVPNPFLRERTNLLALAAPTTTVGHFCDPYPQYTERGLAGRGSFDSTYHSLQLLHDDASPEPDRLWLHIPIPVISNTDTLTSGSKRASIPADNNNLRANASLSSQDVPQRLVISYGVDLPSAKARSTLQC